MTPLSAHPFRRQNCHQLHILSTFYSEIHHPTVSAYLVRSDSTQLNSNPIHSNLKSCSIHYTQCQFHIPLHSASWLTLPSHKLHACYRELTTPMIAQARNAKLDCNGFTCTHFFKVFVSFRPTLFMSVSSLS
jgi:hypothetical protein